MKQLATIVFALTALAALAGCDASTSDGGSASEADDAAGPGEGGEGGVEGGGGGEGGDGGGGGGGGMVPPDPGFAGDGGGGGGWGGGGWGDEGGEGEGGEGGGGVPGMAPPEPDAPAAGPDDDAEPEEAPDPVECPDDGPTSHFLSADDSNSQASPVLARRLIEAGRYVPGNAVRTYEFLNYADFAYPAPDSGLAIHPELRPVDGEPGRYELQIGVRSADMSDADRRPLNLVLVLDSSGSMAGAPLRLLRDSVRVLLSNLRGGDLVSVVRLDAEPALLIDGQDATELDADALLDPLLPNGVTNLSGALELAYDAAGRHAAAERLNRVVLLSDGGANAGELDVARIAGAAGDARSEGIYLVGVGLGEGYNDSLMDAVTDAGKGAYFLIDSVEEARKMFGERFVQNFEIAALDVQVELVLPGRFSVITFRGEQISTNPAEVRPQNLAPSDQMVFSQEIGTCAADAVTGEEPLTVRVRYVDATTGEPEEEEVVTSLAELTDAPADNLAKGQALVAFAEGLTELWPIRFHGRSAIEEACAPMLGGLDTLQDDADVAQAAELAARYCETVREGERHAGACDCSADAGFAQALGVCEQGAEAEPREGAVGSEGVSWGAYGDLYESDSTRAREGCKFAALSTGEVGEAVTIPGLARSCGEGNGGPYDDPHPAFYGLERTQPDGAQICDLNQVSLRLTAPADAHSLSFDFQFFSAEYPEYIGSEFNDTFYAILEAGSTNDGAPTNISFDAAGKAIEINNNYFANPFHPCDERGTGFVYGGSTCWLRTSWPVEPGEEFTLTFSVHDEGDAIYTSTVLLDNLQFHPDDAIGMTDPLN